MKKLQKYIILAVSSIVMLLPFALALFAVRGICAAIYGEHVLRVMSGISRDPLHPVNGIAWLIAVPCLAIAMIGGIPLFQLTTAYTNWIFGQREKPDFYAWYERVTGEI